MSTGPTRITDEQCDEFRKHPGTFNDMVRAIYEAGFQKIYKMLEEAQAECWKRGTEIQRLKDAPAPAQGVLTDAEIEQMANTIAGVQTNPHERQFWEFGPRTLSQFARAVESRGQVSDAADAWQLIATAPKDGTYVMLSNGVNVAQGWWEHQEPYVREKRDMSGNYIDQDEHDGFDDWLDCNGGMMPDPTHWQHLPAPPAIQAQAGDAQSGADHG